MSIAFKSFLVGTGALLATVFLIAATLTVTGEPLQSTMVINSVLGCYLIGSPVAYYLMKQSRKYEAALLEKALLLEQLEIAHEKLQRHAQLDIMTGLLNREAFFVAVEEAKSNNPSAKSTMLIADIDNFKIINDTWGHLEGDQAILKVAEVIKNTAGPNAIVGRIGGEEFAVFIADETSQPATITAENIRRNVEAVEFYPVKNLRQTLTLSIGGAMAMNNGVTSDLVRRADRTLYRAKNDGRNCVQFEMAS